MKYLLYLLNVVLVIILIFIIVYPSIKASRVQEIRIVAYENLGSFPIFVAKNQGLFKKYKLKDSIRYIRSMEDPFSDLRRGRFEVLVGAPVSNFLFTGVQAIGNFRLLSLCYSDSSNPQIKFLIRTTLRTPKLREIERGALLLPEWRNESEYLRQILKGKGVNINEKQISEFSTVFPPGTWKSVLIEEPAASILADSEGIHIFERNAFLNEIVNPYPFAGVFLSQTGVYFKNKALERFHKLWDESIQLIQNLDKEKVDSLLISYEKEILRIENPKIVPLPTFIPRQSLQDLPLIKLNKWMREQQMTLFEGDFSPLFIRIP